MNKDFQDRIDEYVLGRMSEEEKAQFETEINQDGSKKEQLEFTRNVRGAITSREDKLARMRIMQKMYNREHHQVAASMRATGTDDRCYTPAPQCAAEKKPSKRIWWWASGIAAVLVIGLFVINPFGNEFSPHGSSPDEIIRGDENDVFDIETPIINDSIANDTIPPRDTIIVGKEKLDKVDE